MSATPDTSLAPPADPRGSVLGEWWYGLLQRSGFFRRANAIAYSEGRHLFREPRTLLVIFVQPVMLLVLFAGGSYWKLFPLRGLTSDNWEELSLIGKVIDYF